MQETFKNAGKTFLKGLIPLFLTFLGTVFGSLIGQDPTAGTALGATLGRNLKNKGKGSATNLTALQKSARRFFFALKINPHDK